MGDSWTVGGLRNIFSDEYGILEFKFNSLYLIQLSDDSFENSNKTPRQPKNEVKKKDTVPWWMAEGDFEDGGKYRWLISDYLTTRGQSRLLILDFVTYYKYIKKMVLIVWIFEVWIDFYLFII